MLKVEVWSRRMETKREFLGMTWRIGQQWCNMLIDEACLHEKERDGIIFQKQKLRS